MRSALVLVIERIVRRFSSGPHITGLYIRFSSGPHITGLLRYASPILFHLPLADRRTPFALKQYFEPAKIAGSNQVIFTQ